MKSGNNVRVSVRNLLYVSCSLYYPCFLIDKDNSLDLAYQFYLSSFYSLLMV